MVRRWDLGEKNEEAQREGRELAAGAVERMTEAEGFRELIYTLNGVGLD